MTATAPAIPASVTAATTAATSAPSAAELAAALRVLEPEAREECMAAELRRPPAEREEPDRRPGHGHAHQEHDQPELERPSGSASQPGWYSKTRS